MKLIFFLLKVKIHYKVQWETHIVASEIVLFEQKRKTKGNNINLTLNNFPR